MVLLVSLPVNAVIIGDKNWLQVTDTTNNSWNDFNAVFDTATGQYDGAGLLLGGVDVSAYTWANNSEVNDLFISYLGGTGLANLNSDHFEPVGVNSLDGFFGDFNPTQTNVFALSTRGFTRSSNAGGSGDTIEALARVGGIDNLDDILILEIHQLSDIKSSTIGGWLYQTVPVPEPSIITLFGLGLIGLGFARRRMRN